MTDAAQVDNVWAAVAVIGTAVVTILGGWLMQRAKATADRNAEQAQPVLQEAQRAVQLAPEVQSLARMLTDLQSRFDAIEPIATTKYPIALEHIGLVHVRFPEVRDTVPIPGLLRDDLK